MRLSVCYRSDRHSLDSQRSSRSMGKTKSYKVGSNGGGDSARKAYSKQFASLPGDRPREGWYLANQALDTTSNSRLRMSRADRLCSLSQWGDRDIPNREPSVQLW